jgi:hypothetical protein
VTVHEAYKDIVHKKSRRERENAVCSHGIGPLRESDADVSPVDHELKRLEPLIRSIKEDEFIKTETI